MADLTTSAAVDTFMGSADQAAMRGNISLGNVDNTSDANKPVSTAAGVRFSKLDSIEEGIAATGTNHATGYGITEASTRFTTVTGAAYAAAMPEASTLTVGQTFKIYNDDSADPLTVFPEASDNLGSGVGTGVVVEAGDFIVLIVLDGTNFKAVASLDTVDVHFFTGNATATRKQMFGGVWYVTSASEIELQPVEPGMNWVVKTIGNIAVSVDPNASDLIYLDGTALDDGDKITNASTAGDLAAFSYYDSTGFYAATNGWTDGGA